MARFKVGDKVRVKAETLRDGDNRKKCVGKVLTIRTVNPNGCGIFGMKGTHYGFGTDSPAYGWVFYDYELEPVGFTKDDLKDGMVVETREPAHVSRYLVLGEHFIQERGTLDLCFYNDDLTRNDKFGEFDIVKVYKASARNLNDLFRDSRLELIWERPEEESHKEMTVEEIEKELGYKIKVVGKE